MAENENNTETSQDKWVAIKKAAQNTVETSSQQVLNSLIQKRADESIQKRTTDAQNAFDTIQTAQANLNKLRPDIVTYTPQGEANNVYSESQFKKRKSLTEKLDNANKAFDAIFADSVSQELYDKLNKAVAELKQAAG